MKLCRFNKDRFGIVEGETLKDVTAALDVLPQVRYPLPSHDPLIAHLAAVRPCGGCTRRPGQQCDAAQPGRQPGQARGRTGELPEAS
jgi:2,4-diketo-3-deoxy-L-fuconate hydrolase